VEPEAVPLSVLMPAYNEEQAIASAVSEVQLSILDRIAGAELVVVNDGSRDRTGRVLDDIASRNPRVRVFHQLNSGHGGALRAALEAARGQYLFLLDSDRQIPLDDFSIAWSQIASGSDAVFGVRRRRQDAALRIYLSRGVGVAVRALFSVSLVDGNVPYKLFRRDIWREARQCIPPGTLAPSLFLAIFAKRRGYRIVELEVLHRQRATGVVSIRRWKLLKFCAVASWQVLLFRRRLSHVD
jgi:dolichol-phosphate mannosyltransferase